MFGRMWREHDPRSAAPSARAASTNSRSRIDEHLAAGQPGEGRIATIPIAIIAFADPRPERRRIAIASTSAGNASSASMSA